MVITVLAQVTKVSENASLFGKGGGREGTSERHCTVFTGLQKNTHKGGQQQPGGVRRWKTLRGEILDRVRVVLLPPTRPYLFML